MTKYTVKYACYVGRTMGLAKWALTKDTKFAIIIKLEIENQRHNILKR